MVWQDDTPGKESHASEESGGGGGGNRWCVHFSNTRLKKMRKILIRERSAPWPGRVTNLGKKVVREDKGKEEPVAYVAFSEYAAHKNM
jgi:hypothetical protein